MSDSTHAGTSGSPESVLGMELDGLIRGISVGAHFSVRSDADICYSLELFLPRVLRAHYPAWERESLDGIFVARATKSRSAAAELVGTCILIGDQTVTPFLTELEVVDAPNRSSVGVIRLLLGEPGTGSLGVSGPLCNTREAQRLLDGLLERIDDVDWIYKVEQQPS